MTTPITNYTTYDLAYYYADLKRLAPLSQEQRHTLFSSVSVTQTTRSCTDAERRQHHIESYLPLVKHLAITLCPPRAQAILCLRYGLGDDNEHRPTTNEIVQLLRLDRKAILLTERDAMARLKAFVTGKATLGTKNGKTCIRYPGAQKTYTLTPEQETALRHACHDLEAQGVSVTGRSLAKAARVSVARALLFLRLHSPTSMHPVLETPKHVRARQREARLTQVYTRLQAQRGRVTSSLLAKEAQVKKQTAVDFLKARKGEVEHAAV